MKPLKENLLAPDVRKSLEKEFEVLKDTVSILAFTSDETNREFNEFSRRLLGELSGISPKIVPGFEDLGGELARRFNVSRSPTLLIQPEKYGIRFVGAPAGEEVRTLLLTLLMASTGKTILSDSSRQRMAGLKEKRSIKVFVSPTCPYCPQQAAMAISMAIELPGVVETEIIDIYENRDLAVRYDASSVPQVFIDDRLVGLGVQPEEVFVEEVMTAAPIHPKPFEGGGLTEKDLVIIGAGPAGLTAGLYAARSGLGTVILEKGNIGGQVAVTPVVENYPGFTKIGGKTLMDMMAQQAIRYTDIHEGEEVLEAERKDERFLIKTGKAQYLTKAVLITTGAESRKLGVPGEAEFQGKGVSYCAACDGYFFKDGKKVIVVGGGNTAATEALYLKNIGVDVTIVHRRDRLRAEQYLQQSLADNRIPIIWNTEVRAISGGRTVTGVVLEDVAGGTTRTTAVDGVFVAIGYVPANEIAAKLALLLDEEGYVKTDGGYRTSVKGVYAAGDVTGGVKQIVTAVGQGAVAATTIFEDISNPYWKKANP